MTVATGTECPSMPGHRWLENRLVLGIWCVVAAFGTYACMYGFRKPFTAGTFLEVPFGPGSKEWFVIAQVLGYTVSKFVGIRVISEVTRGRRASLLLGLIGIAEAGWLVFGWLLSPWRLAGPFLNGLALGMVFGLVLRFLEGRRLTEAFVAGLCASFILADGLAKTVGAWLLGLGVGERWMPAWAGLVFLGPLLGFVRMLELVPPPTEADVQERSERAPMTSADRQEWFRRYGSGILWIAAAYLLVTVLRSLRADFAPEIWTALGLGGRSGVFTRSEIWVALAVMAANGVIVVVRENRRAFALSMGISLGGLALVLGTLGAWSAGWLGGFEFMVLLGTGLYLPYVAVHVTVFERLIAMTRLRGNAAYLMYVVDALGYLGYVAVMFGKGWFGARQDFLSFFIQAAGATSLLGALAFGAAWWRFWRGSDKVEVGVGGGSPASVSADLRSGWAPVHGANLRTPRETR